MTITIFQYYKWYNVSGGSIALDYIPGASGAGDGHFVLDITDDLSSDSDDTAAGIDCPEGHGEASGGVRICPKVKIILLKNVIEQKRHKLYFIMQKWCQYFRITFYFFPIGIHFHVYSTFWISCLVLA